MKFQNRCSIWSLTCAFAFSGILILLLASCMVRKNSTITPLFPGSSGFRDAESPRALGASGLSSDEIWIVARGNEPASTKSEDSPGPGALIATLQDKQIPMPLKHTDVKAS